MSEAGRQRVVITAVTPEIDGGRFPIRRVVGEAVVVEADAFADGRDAIACRLLVRPAHARAWSEAPMTAQPGDRWRASFTAGEVGRWQYTVTAWVDHFKTWRRDLRLRVDAGQDVTADLLRGAALVRDAARRADEEQKPGERKTEARILAALAADLETGADPAARLRLALDDELALLMDRHTDRRFATTYRELNVVVDRERARFCSWCETDRGEDAAMGFDVLAGAKPKPQIDSHIEPGVETAVTLDGPAGDFDGEDWRTAWKAQKGVVDRWIAQGVRIFTVEEPDAWPFAFWEWLIGAVKHEHPDVLFLAVASARPKVMDRLARLGFTWIRRELREASPVEPDATRDLWRSLLWVSPGGADFHQRLVLAATQAASYGVSAGELPDGVRDLITRLNAIRRENPAFQSDRGLRFHPTDNDRILCFSRVDAKAANALLVAVNLDPVQAQSGWLELPGDDLGLPRDQPYPVHDLLSGARYLWHGTRSFVQLDPQPIPALVFRVRGRRGNDRR
ncbi:MAG TPA: maltotransferase domain-containing protein [Thermoanaerobaculia bacterium]|jgi:hypothetical protein|nr:maltotransferase domain-containing protein [Thermoanaerobaculia bacterium]